MRPDEPTIARLPDDLRRFLKLGRKKFRCDDGDWKVRIQDPTAVSKMIPSDAVIVAGNGCGDHLFLESSGDKFGADVFAYWHDEPAIRNFGFTISELTFPPSAAPSVVSPIFYSAYDGQVALGDRVGADHCGRFLGSATVRSCMCRVYQTKIGRMRVMVWYGLA